MLLEIQTVSYPSNSSIYAVTHAMKLNEIYTHENHNFPVKGIFYPTKITHYTFNITVHLLIQPPSHSDDVN